MRPILFSFLAFFVAFGSFAEEDPQDRLAAAARDESRELLKAFLIKGGS